MPLCGLAVQASLWNALSVASSPFLENRVEAACGEYALVTREGGYSVYKPLLAGEYDAEIPVYRIPDGPAFSGKPTVRGNTLVACNRIDGDVTLVDITDLKAPRLVKKFKISGNPNLAFIGDGVVLIPAGRQD